MDKERILEVLLMIKEDTENDVKNLDGKLLNGTNVATMFGSISASIDAMCNILIAILKTEDNKNV